MAEQMYRFQTTALDSTDDLRVTVALTMMLQSHRQISPTGSSWDPSSRSKMVSPANAHRRSDNSGQQDDPTTHADQRGPSRWAHPHHFETGRQVAESFTIESKTKHSVAVDMSPT
ncbi:uncharacterized protein FFFS_15799 [Fusarium fujikuroi]|nr:uncharacterized protein FFFS_15799 [Fusarium fujikuroi]